MGKGSDKMYITATEWSLRDGGMNLGGVSGKKGANEFKRLPFYSCALSLAPFEVPMMAPDGAIFDLVNIVPFLKKHGVHPLTGEKLSSKDLVKLTFHKNQEGDYYCPVTYKTFNENTHIVAIKTSGQVYAFEAVQKLNYAAKNMFDLLTNDPFTKKDVITIQDPHNLEGRNLNQFFYVTHNLKVDSNGPAPTVNAVGTTSRALKELEAKQKEKEEKEKAAIAAVVPKTAQVTPSFVTKETLASNAAHFSNNQMAAGFTSTSYSAPVTKNERYVLDEESRMFAGVVAKPGTKGYAALKTNFGQINLELHADQAPKTVYNFIMLAKGGYYNGVKFHRNIKNFIIQGGDPTGTGRGGQSYWKRDFEDEIKGSLKHEGRGILSMANKGAGTNSSQFFLTYKSAPHLNGKHTVFGKVVGGLEVLAKMEEVPSEEKTDKPSKPIIIQEVDVVVDPFEDWKDAQLRDEEKKIKEAEREQKANKEMEANRKAREAREKGISNTEAAPLDLGFDSTPSTSAAPAVGKYLKAPGTAAAAPAVAAVAGTKREGGTMPWDNDDDFLSDLAGSASAPAPKKAKTGSGYGDFSSF